MVWTINSLSGGFTERGRWGDGWRSSRGTSHPWHQTCPLHHHVSSGTSTWTWLIHNLNFCVSVTHNSGNATSMALNAAKHITVDINSHHSESWVVYGVYKSPAYTFSRRSLRHCRYLELQICSRSPHKRPERPIQVTIWHLQRLLLQHSDAYTGEKWFPKLGNFVEAWRWINRNSILDSN